ncbi:MAG: hypothetical protein LLF75_00255 [Eubacteriales bacterium]|nr:hypothetical protein [Eubacteriales bacterium]
MPERLEPNAIDTITVVLSDLPDDLNADVRDQFAAAFEQNEYLLLQAGSLLQSGFHEAANQIVAQVDEQLRHGELTKVMPMRFNLVLYATLEPAACEKLEQLRKIVFEIGGQLGILNAYACILKQYMRGEENALAMDRCAEVCKADGDRPQIPILLVNRGLGITIDLPLKASVRYLHIISRNSRLKVSLLGKTELVMSIALLEYDDANAISLQQQILRLQSEMELPEAAKGQMYASVQTQMDAAAERLNRNDLLQLANFPLRTDAIGNLFSVLFGRRILRHALDDTAETLAIVYQKNIHERFCDGSFRSEEAQKKLFELLDSYPVAYIRSRFKQDLEELGKKYTQSYEAYAPELRICLGEKRLRAQLGVEYQKSLDRSRAYLRRVVIREMGRQADVYIAGGRLEQREKEIRERILRLKAKAHAVGNARSAADFLQTQLAFLPTQGGVSFESCLNSDMILLLSKKMDDNWGEYAPYLPNTPQFDIYNYGMLEDQELQALQIMRFDAALYQQNRKLIFQIK